MRIYELVCLKASAGACINSASLSLFGTMARVTRAAIRAKIIIPHPIPLPARSFLSAPMESPINTVIPIVRPVMTIVIILNSWLPVATPDCSKVPANWPTIIRSAAPYMACKNNARSTGNAKDIRELNMFPSVRLCSFIYITFLIFWRVKLQM